ncbi:MAG: hypothetical protein JXB05_13195, partial [Myxococcaceae bacterium]|nr:hypothetical protein [Myxococcaceae bacterium]
GGGGRVAVYYDTASSSFDLSRVYARGGYQGGAGSIFLKGTAQAHGELIFDNEGNAADLANVHPTEIFGTPEGQQTFDNLFIRRRAWVVTPDELLITGTLSVDFTSHLQAKNYTLP